MSSASTSATRLLGAVGKYSAKMAGVEAIRSQFPALEREHMAFPVAYFDGPGGTQVPRRVIEAVADYLSRHNANTHWNYPTSHETDEILAEARRALADFVGGHPEEIVFGANATSLAFHVSRTLGRLFTSNDEIVVTELDHHANVGPWEALARERGCELRVVHMDSQIGTIDWTDFEQKVNARTKLVAVGAASNALGTVTDIERVARITKEIGAYLFVDAVHFAPHFFTNVQAMGCDFLLCSAYKFYGPHIGVMWCRNELLAELPFPKLRPAPDTGPERAETGTLNHEGIAGAAAAVDFLGSLVDRLDDLTGNDDVCRSVGGGPASSHPRRELLRDFFAAYHRRSAALTKKLWNGLVDTDGVTLYGPPLDLPRTSTVAFTIRGVASSEVARRLSERSLFLSHGNFYAATVIERLGLEPEGLVRAGCAIYTTDIEIERLVAAVADIARS